VEAENPSPSWARKVASHSYVAGQERGTEKPPYGNAAARAPMTSDKRRRRVPRRSRSASVGSSARSPWPPSMRVWNFLKPTRAIS